MKILAFTLVLTLGAGAAHAATPAAGSREADLVCVPLLDVGIRGAKASEGTPPDVVNALSSAYGIFVGRASAQTPPATAAQAGALLEAMSLAEKTAAMNGCLRRASALLGGYLAQQAR